MRLGAPHCGAFCVLERRLIEGKMSDKSTFEHQTLNAVVSEVSVILEESGLFFGHGLIDAEEEASWLVLSACRMGIDTEPDWNHRISAADAASIKALLQARIDSRKPLAYLIGESWFAGYPFFVDGRVLVPRSFIGEWIPEQFSPWIDASRVHRILDLCCGSGCIGIAAALSIPTAEVVLSDLSEDALAVASRNIERHQVEDRVSTVLSDGLKNVGGTFDLVLCNPPYVSEPRMAQLPAEYRHEPALALAAGEDGLAFITPLLARVTGFLNPGGALILETGSAGNVVQQTWPTVPFTWLGTEFDEMVLCMLTREELITHRDAIVNPLQPTS